jgi:hypothetical protein
MTCSSARNSSKTNTAVLQNETARLRTG